MNAYVFAIGGTGARVLRSLTMLLASGVELPGINKLIPVIIDLDTKNEDTLRTIRALQNYKAVRDQFYSDTQKFFKTEISTLKNMEAETTQSGTLNEDFQIEFANIDATFWDYMEFEKLPTNADKDFLKLLYDNSSTNEPNTELNLNLKVGFKGNPNVGSIIFNELKETPEYKYFLTAIQPGDKIFIISSIFGGTGSSGFPQLIKIFKSANQQNNNIGKAKIGALTVLPYFNVSPNSKSAINSKRFASKAKAALSYYSQDAEFKKVNAMYYIADGSETVYNNNEGGELQKNEAHRVELMGASSLIHFFSLTDSDLGNKTKHFEYAIKPIGEDKKTAPPLIFSNFFDKGTGVDFNTKDIVFANLTKFKYFSKIYREFIPKNLDKDFSKNLELDKDSKTNEYKHIKAFVDEHFYKWLEELHTNQGMFTPFNLNGHFDDMVKGKNITQKGKLYDTHKIDDSFLKNVIGKAIPRYNSEILDKKKRFLQVMSDASNECFNKLEKLP